MQPADDTITLPYTTDGTAAVGIAGILSDAAIDQALSDGSGPSAGYLSWLYLNPANTEACRHIQSKVLAAGRAWEVVEIDKGALTMETAEQAIAALEELPRPCLVTCSTATRAGAVLLLSLAKARGLSFQAAMQLACDMRLKFAAGYVVGSDAGGGEAPSALVQWVQQATATFASSELIVRAPGLRVTQLFDQRVDRGGGGSSTYTYLLADVESQEAVLVDPVLEQVERDLAVVDGLGLHLKYVLNTHAHADHITGSGRIKAARSGVRSVISRASGAKADLLVSDGDTIRFGSQELRVLYTPGHTEGCVSYATEGLVLTGDAVLIRGCGRTDFQGGSAETLFDSVHAKLWTMPPDTVLAPAHDYKGRNISSIGDELHWNPRLAMAKTKADFVSIMASLNLPYPKKFDASVPQNMLCGIGTDLPNPQA